jgi:hypothetical protein
MGKLIETESVNENILQIQLDSKYLFAERTHLPTNEYVYCVYSNGYESRYYFWREHEHGNIYLRFMTNSRTGEYRTLPGYITRFGKMLCESINKNMSLLDYSNCIIKD